MLPSKSLDLPIDYFAAADDNIDDAWDREGGFDSGHLYFCASIQVRAMIYGYRSPRFHVHYLPKFSALVPLRSQPRSLICCA